MFETEKMSILKVRAFFVYNAVSTFLVHVSAFRNEISIFYFTLLYANEWFKIKHTHTNFLYLLCFWYCTMEVILNELQNGGVDIDMRTLSYHIQQCLQQYSTMYEQMAILPVNVLEIFEDMGVNNFGRAVAFLTYRLCAGHP